MERAASTSRPKSGRTSTPRKLDLIDASERILFLACSPTHMCCAVEWEANDEEEQKTNRLEPSQPQEWRRTENATVDAAAGTRCALQMTIQNLCFERRVEFSCTVSQCCCCQLSVRILCASVARLESSHSTIDTIPFRASSEECTF